MTEEEQESALAAEIERTRRALLRRLWALERVPSGQSQEPVLAQFRAELEGSPQETVDRVVSEAVRMHGAGFTAMDLAQRWGIQPRKAA